MPVGQDLQFADDQGIAELRTRHPEWQAQSLPPVSIIDDVYLLRSVPDASLDYVIAFHLLVHEHRIYQAADTAARVLRPGGTLLIPVPDERYVCPVDPEIASILKALRRLEQELEDGTRPQGFSENEDKWSCDRLAVVMGRLAMFKRPLFELEAVGRNGADNLVVFRRKNDRSLAPGSLIDRDGAVYVADGSIVRYVPTLQILERIRRGKPVVAITEREFSLLVPGPPITEHDLPTFLNVQESSK